jgi:hypothetical protein
VAYLRSASLDHLPKTHLQRLIIPTWYQRMNMMPMKIAVLARYHRMNKTPTKLPPNTNRKCRFQRTPPIAERHARNSALGWCRQILPVRV